MGKQEFFDLSDDNEIKAKRTFLIAPIVFLSVIAVVLAIGGAVLLREYFESRELARNIETERDYFAFRSDSLLLELQNLDEAFNNLTTENQSLSEQVRRYRREINSLQTQIAQLAGPEFERSIAGFQARIAHLESELARFQSELLLAQESHRRVSDEHSLVQIALEAAKQRVSELETVEKTLTHKVDLGSRLTVVYLEIFPSFTRRALEQVTDRARRVTHLRVCFTILENLLAAPGDKKIYLRVVDEEGNIALRQPVGSFIGPQGTQMEYLAAVTVHYKNKELDECIGFTIPAPVSPGVYTVSLFVEGHELQSRVFELK